MQIGNDGSVRDGAEMDVTEATGLTLTLEDVVCARTAINAVLLAAPANIAAADTAHLRRALATFDYLLTLLTGAGADAVEMGVSDVPR